MNSILFQLLLRFMLSDLRLYFVSVMQNIFVSISVSLNEIIYIYVSVSVSVNEYNTGVFPTRSPTLNFFINFTFLTAAYFLKAQYRLFVLKVPLNPSQSSSHSCNFIIILEWLELLACICCLNCSATRRHCPIAAMYCHHFGKLL